MKIYIYLIAFLAYNFCYAEENIRTINVNGSATIKVSSDIFIISCKITGHDDKGIDISEKSAQNKLDELGKIINIDALTITGRYSSKVQKINPNGESIFNGYDTAIYFSIKANEINKFRSHYKNVLGINSIEISGVEYKSSKEFEYREKARELALIAARKKAIQMAAVMDVKIGNVIKIAEINHNGYDNRFSNNTNIASSENLAGDYMEGQIEISSNVNLEFQLQ